jgi:predicted O-methyltransferase YrrM
MERLEQIQDYIQGLFAKEEPALQALLEKSKKEGLKEIQLPAATAKMVYLLAKLTKPKRILEIGTLGGYSAFWLAKALMPGGTILSLEKLEKNAAAARRNLEAEERVEVVLGDALETMACLHESFDLIFIDADKEQYSRYLEAALKLSHPGTLILIDNLIPKRGAIEKPDPRDNEAVAIYAFNQMMARHPQLESTLFTTLAKGKIDALGVAIVK